MQPHRCSSRRRKTPLRHAASWVFCLLLALASPAVRGETITVFAAGDVLLGRGVAPHLAAHTTSLDLYREEIGQADLAFCNLECALSDAPATRTRLLAAPSSVSCLKSAGFDIVSLANNHALDAGEKGLGLARSRLSAAGIVPVGAQVGDGDQAEAKTTVRRRRIVWLAASAWGPFRSGKARVRPLAGSGLMEQVRALAGKGNIVFVSLHWGVEHSPAPTGGQRQTARALVDAGASAIFGHHPHVTQPVEVYKNRPIFYSLGNFLFDRMSSAQDGMAAVVSVDDRGAVRYRLLAPASPVPLPAPPPGETVRAALAARLLPDRTGGQALVWTRRTAGDDALRLYRTESSGGSWRQFADARLSGVRDARAGDIDSDGRDDAVLLLQGRGKLDSATRPRLHVYGYDARRGIYAKWRGSGLSRPFREFRLLPRVGGCDLVALETDLRPDYREFEWLSVYRWNGFGFSGIWETPVRGAISDLRTGTDEQGAFIRFLQKAPGMRRMLTVRAKKDGRGFATAEVQGQH